MFHLRTLLQQHNNHNNLIRFRMENCILHLHILHNHCSSYSLILYNYKLHLRTLLHSLHSSSLMIRHIVFHKFHSHKVRSNISLKVLLILMEKLMVKGMLTMLLILKLLVFLMVMALLLVLRMLLGYLISMVI
jgi:hypothetical protein